MLKQQKCQTAFGAVNSQPERHMAGSSINDRRIHSANPFFMGHRWRTRLFAISMESGYYSAA